MRNKAVWFLVAILLLIIGVQGYFLLFASNGDVIAKVGNKTITEHDWVHALKDMYGEEVLDDLINREVVSQAATQLGIHISEQQIMNEIDKLKRYYNSEEEYLAVMGEYIEDYKSDLRFNLLLEAIATKDVHITDPEIEAYYKQNIDQYTEPARIHLHEIIVETEADALRIIAELKEGANFGALALEQSLDLFSSSNNGDLGWVDYDDPTIQYLILEAAFQLEVNEISDPVPLERGYAILLVTDKVKEKVSRLDEVHEEIHRELALSKVDSLVTVLEKLRAEQGVEIILSQLGDN